MDKSKRLTQAERKKRIDRYMSDYKDTLYIDMDNVLVDFKSGIETLSESELEEYRGRYDEVPHISSRK